VPRAGFATRDEPVNVLQVQAFERTKQRLGTDEAYGGRRRSKVVRSMHEAAVLNADTHPDVGMPRQSGREFSQALVTLRQHLEGVPRRLAHHGKDFLDKRHRNVLMEQIAHRVDEDHSRATPAQRLHEPLRPEAKIKALFVRVSRYASPAFSEGLGVAVCAARRHLAATRDGVPRGFRPFNGAAVSHAPGAYLECPCERMFAPDADVPLPSSLGPPALCE